MLACQTAPQGAKGFHLGGTLFVDALVCVITVS